MYVYFGSDHFSLEMLKGLCEISPPCAIVTQPDRPAGRKQQLKPGPLAVFAKEQNIPLYQPEKLKTAEQQDPILALGASLFIVVSFGQILPQSFLDRSPTIINGHASLLPKFRGASPIQSVILNGEKESGMTIMHIVKALDAGPMISQKSFVLNSSETHESLSNKLIRDGIEMTTPYISGQAVPAGDEQDHSAATHCGKLIKKDTFLDPCSRTAEELDRIIRAFSPSPGAFLRIQTPKGDKQFKLILTEFTDVDSPAGTFKLHTNELEKNELLLGCAGSTSLLVKMVQLEGKPAMPTTQFLNGFRGELQLAQT
jgi:methionyl-tRNA formyltransferase